MPRAPHRHDHPHAGDRPGLPAPQAPRPGAGVLRSPSAPSPSSTPRRPRSGARPRSSSTSTRCDWRGRGRATLLTSASRSTSTTGRTRRRRCSGSRWRTCSARRAAARCKRAGARRLRHRARDRDPGAALPRRHRRRASGLRAARLGGRGRADRARRGVRGLGRLALRPAPAHRRGPTRRCAQPAPRAAARCWTSRSTTGRARRGRQAPAVRRGLAGDPPGARR